MMAIGKKNIKPKNIIFLILITSTFLFLCFYKLGSISLWLDEIMSVDFCDGSFSELLTDLREDVHAPLFYILLFLQLKIFWLSELNARLISVFAGAATIIALFFLANEFKKKETAPPSSALLSCLLLALSPYFIRYSREVHPYSLSAFFSVLSWLFFIRLIKTGKEKYGIYYSIFSGGLLLTFYPGIVMVLSQIILIFFLKISFKKKKLFFICTVISALIFSIWMPVFFYQLKEYKIGIIEKYFPNGITYLDVIYLIFDKFLGFPAQYFEIWFIALLDILLIIFTFSKIISPIKQTGVQTGIQKTKRNFSYIILWMFWAPFLLFTGVCLIKPIYLGRYITMLIPFAVLILGTAIAKLKDAKYVLIFTIFILSLFSFNVYIKNMPRQDWHGVAEFISSHIKPLDVVVTDNTTSQSCLNYYFKMLGREDLNKNVFTLKMFMDLTKGVYKYPDRTLWVFARTISKDDDQLYIVFQKNILTHHFSFKYRLFLYSFKKM